MPGVCGCRAGKWDGVGRQKTENKVSEQQYSIESKHVRLILGMNDRLHHIRQREAEAVCTADSVCDSEYL